MRAAAPADLGDQLARSYQDEQTVSFDRFVRTLGVGGSSHEDALADLIRADVQQRLVRGLPLSLADYAAAPGVGESDVLLDAAVQAIVHAQMARGRTRQQAFAELRRDNPGCESRIETAEVLSSLLGSSDADPPQPTTLPRRLGPRLAGGARRYELLHQLGHGSQAVVYRAIDHELSSPERPSWVAVKVWPVGRGVGAPARRLLAEAQRARQIDHPGVIKVFDAGVTPEGEAFMVTPIIEGRTLEEAVAAHDALPADRLASWMIQVCAGVQAIHAAGLLHRDLKPGNILIDPRGEAVVSDLGLSVRNDGARREERVGTLAFGAPEQWSGHGLISQASDTYALGAALLWALTGLVPHGADRPSAEAAVASPAAHRAALAPALAAVRDRRLRRICERATAFEPRLRYASAEGLAADLAAWRARDPIPWMKPTLLQRGRLWASRSPWQVGFAVALLLTAVVAPSAVFWARARAQASAAEAAAARAEADANTLKNAQTFFRNAVETIKPVHNVSWRDANLPSLLILESVVGPKFLGENGLLGELWADRLAESGANLAEAKKGTINWALWATVHGMWTLQAERFDEAYPLLVECEDAWRKLCEPDDPWLADVQGLRAVAEIRMMQKRRLDAVRTQALRPDFTPDELARVQREAERIVADPRPTRRVYYLAVNALIALYGPDWTNRPDDVARLREDANARLEHRHPAAPTR